jgi:catechol 2,3-dioxygenase-like lactoylglutathione lyase family enzyme
MFSHVVLGANDLEKSKIFYDAVIGAIGGKPAVPVNENRFMYMHDGGMLLITRPIDGEPACHANGGTVGFAMTSAEQAEAWHAAGIAAGGSTCEDPPGVREGGFGKIYLAYLRDPAGNKLCAMHRIA